MLLAGVVFAGAATSSAQPDAGHRRSAMMPAPPGSGAQGGGVVEPGPCVSPTASEVGASPTPGEEPPEPPPTAAARYGWTNLVARDDFTGSTLDPGWGVYDSVGHNGNGIRSPEQITLSDGVLRMTGTPEGTTAGMSWERPQKHGRWEIRARFPAGCGCYHPVLLLWPQTGRWPAAGEVDYAEVFDPDRQQVYFFLHYGEENNQLHASREVDMTQWHTFAVEWTPEDMTGYVDGEPYFHTTQRDVLPPGPMVQTIQLDWFPDGTEEGATLEVDWATMYAL